MDREKVMKGKLGVLRDKVPQDDPFLRFAPPGHFYSPLPSLTKVKENEDRIWGKKPTGVPGIGLDLDGQISLAHKFQASFKEIPFGDTKKTGLRYYYENNFYPKGDGQILHCMMRYLLPKKIIEIGSGFSSAAILDTNELFFDNSVACKFIEPYTDRVASLLKKEDMSRIDLVSKNLQDVELKTFSDLNSNDILFIDSTHVSKIDSDVNYILFHILPYIKSGVHIHFHDIFYPFEYPKNWVYEGRAWNESYILRAFLQYNCQFRIVWYHHYLMSLHFDRISKVLPGCGGGGSLWLAKL
jgi:predicted O-methyltransferase YrrM